MEYGETPPPRRTRRVATGIGLLVAGAAVGGVTAATLSASADTTSPSTNSSVVAHTGAPSAPPLGAFRPGGPQPVRSDETQLTGSDAASATAAAKGAVPGGTVYRAETDAGDGYYEVHMTKANGAPVTVKLDKSFKVIGVEDGMGTGDPALPR